MLTAPHGLDAAPQQAFDDDRAPNSAEAVRDAIVAHLVDAAALARAVGRLVGPGRGAHVIAGPGREQGRVAVLGLDDDMRPVGRV